MHFANFSTEGDDVAPLPTVYTGCATFWCDQTLNSEYSDCETAEVNQDNLAHMASKCQGLLYGYIPMHMFLIRGSLMHMFCSPDTVIPVTVHFCGLQTIRKQQWAHVSVRHSSFIRGGGCGRLSPTCSASAVIAILMGMTGRNMCRQTEWVATAPSTQNTPLQQTDICIVLLVCSSQIRAKSQSSCRHVTHSLNSCTDWTHKAKRHPYVKISFCCNPLNAFHSSIW